LPLIVTRRFILQKARRQTDRSHSPPTACRQPVSGSISLPSRGAFHLSLTVLVHYRWQRVLSLRRWSSQIPPGFLVSRGTREISRSPRPFVYRAVTVSGLAFQPVQLERELVTPWRGYRPACCSHDPAAATPVGLTRQRFRLTPVRSPLLGGSRLLSLPRGTKMFQFPRLPPARVRVIAHDGDGVAPFGNPRITACSRLPGAYRRAPRPSSALCPKASTRCPL
jgi:hypothetical protein